MRTLFTVLVFLVVASFVRASETGDEVVVVYNSRLPESKQVADYYAARRYVPTDQIFGFALTTNEGISREEFENALQRPLANALEQKKLWHIGSDILLRPRTATPAR